MEILYVIGRAIFAIFATAGGGLVWLLKVPEHEEVSGMIKQLWSEVWGMRMFIPQSGLMDTVSLNRNPIVAVPRARWFRAIFCSHANTSEFERLDHRTGPGFLADYYHGVVCMDCGYILNEIKDDARS